MGAGAEGPRQPERATGTKDPYDRFWKEKTKRVSMISPLYFSSSSIVLKTQKTAAGAKSAQLSGLDLFDLLSDPASSLHFSHALNGPPILGQAHGGELAQQSALCSCGSNRASSRRKGRRSPLAWPRRARARGPSNYSEGLWTARGGNCWRIVARGLRFLGLFERDLAGTLAHT